MGPISSTGFNPLTGILFWASSPPPFCSWPTASMPTSMRPAPSVTTYAPFILLFVALLIALGFEFVNGFHDTANAVATVIYTRSLPAHIAVVWSGIFNLIGVLLSSGAVAFGIVSLLPVELILQVGSERRFRHGVRAVDRGDHLEPRHLVFRPAGLELAYADRLDHRRRHRQRAAARPQRHLGRRIGIKATKIG